MKKNFATFAVITRWAVIGITGVLPTGCQSRATQPTERSNPDLHPAFTVAGPHFELCAQGLPESGNWKCDPLLADLDGDGNLDVVALARLGDGPHVWLGDGKCGWRDASDGLALGRASCGGGLCLADVNLDGRVELVVADHCQGLFVYARNDAGRWTAEAHDFSTSLEVPDLNDPVGVGFETVVVGDVNGDGLPDLVAGSSGESGICVFHGDGSGRTWTRAESALPQMELVNRIRLLDVNGDGQLDLLATCAAGPRVWLGDGKGNWRPASQGLPNPTIHGLYQGLTVGDVNEDDRLDLCVANWIDGVEIYLQQSDMSWRKSPDAFPQLLGGAYSVVLNDIDGDRHLDLIVSGRLNREQVGHVYGVFVLRGNGKGNWVYLPESKLPQTGLGFTWGVVVGGVKHDEPSYLAAGSGGIVAFSEAAKEPVLSSRLLVWRVTHTATSTN